MILDLIFPKFCLGCAAEGTYLCPRCQNKIVTVKYQTCPTCKIITQRGAWCTTHRKNQALSGIITLGHYHDPILRETIHLIKYRRVDELIKTLATLAASHFSPLIPHAKVILIPVPLHPWRLRFRDFNQAELLAIELSNILQLTSLPVHCLVRTRNTQPQADLPYQKRLTNVSDSFAWIGDSPVIKNKTIWLLDDVATTGATLEECAKVIKLNGAKSVWGLVLAKG